MENCWWFVKINHVEIYSVSQYKYVSYISAEKKFVQWDIDVQLLNTWPWLFKCWIAQALSTG